MPALATLKCVACRGDEPQATAAEIEAWRPEVPEWDLVEKGDSNPSLTRLKRVHNVIVLY